MRSGPQTSSAVTARLPSLRTDTIILIMSSRNRQKAKRAAQSHHPCHKPPKTHSCTQPHSHNQNSTKTALPQHTHPLQLPNSRTAAQICCQLPLLTLWHHPHQTMDTARLPYPLAMLHLSQICNPNLALSLCRPPILQKLLLCLPLWHRPCPSLRVILRPKPLLLQDQSEHKSMDLLQPGKLTLKPRNPPIPATLKPLYLPA